MASKKIKGINIKIGADTKGIETALKGIENKSKYAKDELFEINRTLKNTPENLTIWKQKQNVLNKAIEESKNKVKLLEDAQEQVAKQLADGKISDEQYRAFQRELEKARAEVSRFDEQLYDTNKQIEKLGEKSKDSGKELKNSLEDAQDELKKVDKSIKKAPDSLVLWKQKQELLTKTIEESRKKVKSLENQQEEMKKKFRNGEIDEGAYRAFQRELEEARGEAKDLENQLGDTNKKIYDFENGTENGRKGVANLGDSMEDAGKDADELGDSVEESGKDAEKASDGYTVFKDVLGNLVTQGINLAIDKVKEFTTEIIETGKAFEASMSNVGAISGATGDELEKLSEKAKQMGATTKYTASQAADAFGYMALAGWETEDMLAGIDGVLSLAAASNMDLARASDIVTDYLTAFGLTAQDSSKFVDQMSYAMSKSNTTTELLGEAYKNCAATAASMGYSVEETTAVLMTMANAGVKGGEAGTALNAIMTRLATDTKGCASQLAKFGINVYDTQGNMQSLSSILQGVSGVWTTLTDQQQANIAKIIAGTNHYSALQTIMNGLSDSAKESGMSFTDYASALEECDGTAQNMADTMIDNLAGDMTILDSSIDGVKIALSDKLNPIIRDLVQYITEKMPEIQKSSEKAIDTVVLIVEWCRKHMPEIKETAKDLIPYIIGIGSGFAGWNVATKVIPAVTKLFSAVKSGNVVMKLANTIMSANPAVAVTTAIVGLTGAFIVWKKVQEDEVSIADKVNEKYKEQTERIQGIKDEIENLEQSSYDSAAAIDDETQKVKNLWKELHELAGESNNVRSEDKKRAEYILGELNEALGTEYTMTGNQIENYQTLAGEIDKVIEKKQAEAYIDSWLAQSSEMAKQKKDAESKYIEMASDAEIKRKERQEAWEVFHNSVKDTGNKYLSPEEIMAIVNSNHSYTVVTEEQRNAAGAYLTAIENEKKAKNLAEKAKISYNQAVNWQNTLDEAMYLSENGKSEEAIKLMENFSGMDLSAYENATEDEKLTAYNILANALKHRFNLAIESNNQSEIDSLLEDLAYNLNEGQELRLSFDELFNADVQEALKNIISKGYNISEFTKFGKDSGIDITKFFGQDYSKIFSAQIQKDYNVDDFLEWAALSETKIAKESWDNFKTYVQKRIDNDSTYDITPILKTASDAGIDVDEVFNGEYTKIVQEQIDRGHDPTELIKWFSDTYDDAAKLFKENYMDVSQTLINAGYDPTQMLLHFAETDKEFAKGFKENGKDVIQKMLDKGFDFTSILDGFGLTVNEMFNIYDKNFQKKFQATLDAGFDTTNLFKWAEESGIALAEIFGENMQKYIAQYEWHQGVKSGEYKINSAGDAALYNYGKATKFATGGYISAGNSGIIAEAGPELIEVMNGGVRITPMREKARNTEVSDNTAGQKIFYNTYNLNNPRISNDMDVRQIAQKLAIEQRRIERGRGIF